MTRKLMMLATLSAVALFAAAAHAADWTWDGSTGDWNTPASWGGSNPNLSGGVDTATINAGVATWSNASGGDFINNGTLTVGGTGTWQQDVGKISWSRLGVDAVGYLNVNAGGTFNIAESGNFFAGTGTGSGHVSINAGTGIFNNLVIETAGSTVSVTNGGTLTVNGQLSLTSGGSLTVGGTVTTGTLQFTNGSMSIVNGGSISIAGNFVVPTLVTTLDVSGGHLQINGEFKPQQGTTTVSGGTIDANLISFDSGGANSFDFSGGNINLNPSLLAYAIFSASADDFDHDYVNFTPGSTGVLFINGGDAALANGFINSLNPVIRLDNAAAPGSFNVTEADGGVYISLTSVPEPATMALFGVGSVLIAARRRR